MQTVLFSWLLLLAPTSSLVLRYGVVVTQRTRANSKPPRIPSNTQQTRPFSNSIVLSNDQESSPSSIKNKGYTLSLLASVASWITIAYTALSKHPTTAIQAATSIRHNCFTIAQAVAFPVPILVATFWQLQHLPDKSATFRRLNLGVSIACLWSAAAVVWCPTFSVGYDLFSSQEQIILPSIQMLVAFYALWNWKRSVETDSPNKTSLISRLIDGTVESFYSLLTPASGKQCLALATKGLFVLAILPQLVAFPTATIPTLLGKRLSRAASGFTWLGAVACFCLFRDSNPNEYLRRGLGWGALLHIALVWAKIIGLDGGGLVFPGRGLWKDYPSLVKASGAATSLMMITYSLVVYATMGWKKNEEEESQ